MKTIGLILFALLMMAPAWAIGGNLSHTRTAVLAVAAIAAVVALINVLSDRQHRRSSAIWLLLLLGVGLSAAQLIPLPENAAGLIERTDDVAAKAASVSQSISISPADTRAKLCDLIAAVLIFVAAGCQLRRRFDVVTLMAAAAISGFAMSFFGIIQKLAGDGRILWSYDLINGGVPFGSFVNKNNAGGFLIACMTGVVFFALRQILEWKSAQSARRDMSSDYDSKAWLRGMFGMIAGIQAKHLYGLAAFAFIVAGVFSSLSRGAILAMIVGLLATVVLVGVTNRLVSVGMLAVIAGAVALTFVAEQNDVVSAQLETLSSPQTAAAPRLEHWTSVVPYLKDNLAAGSGLGTYDLAYPMYIKDGTLNRWFRHAENIYIETVAELGVPGLVLLVLVLIGIGVHCRRLCLSQSTLDRALGLAGVFLLVSQMVASAFDFGIYQPGNYCMVATLLGMIVGRSIAPSLTPGSMDAKDSRSIGWPVVSVAVLCLLVLGSAWAVRESHGVESLRHGTRLLKRFDLGGGADNALLQQASSHLGTALAIRPDDPEAQYQMGELQVAGYREIAALDVMAESTAMVNEAKQRAVSDPSRNPIPPLFTRQQAWNSTSLFGIHRLVHRARLLGMDPQKELEAMEGHDRLVDAYAYFVEADRLCPYIPTTAIRKAQLSLIGGKPDQETPALEAAITRWPDHYGVMYQCGMICLNRHDFPRCADLWRRSLSISRRYEPLIMAYGMDDLPMKVLMEDVLIQDPANMIRIARRYLNDDNLTLAQRIMLVHTKRLAESADLEPAEREFLLAQANYLSENFVAAAANFDQAVTLRPKEAQWRFEYAKCLYELRDFEGAITQLKICRLLPSDLGAVVSRWIRKLERERGRGQEYTPPPIDGTEDSTPTSQNSEPPKI